MANPLRNFEPDFQWSDNDGRLTERAKGFLRSLFDYIGAATGTIPSGSVGGDGTTTKFYRADGVFAVPAYPTGADPAAAVGTAAVVGSASTFLRSDAAPALNLGISPTWTGTHTFTSGATFTGAIDGNGAFGCNGATPQTSASVGAAVVTTAATQTTPYGYATQAQADDIVTRLNTIRAALVENGVLV